MIKKECKVKFQNPCVTVIISDGVEIQIPTTKDILGKNTIEFETDISYQDSNINNETDKIESQTETPNEELNFNKKQKYKK